MAFKQRSAFKAKEGGSAFKEMGSMGESPMKWKAWKKFKKGVKKVARNTPIGLGIRALRGDFKKRRGGALSGGLAGIKEKMKKAMEARKAQMLELEDLQLMQGRRGSRNIRKLTSKESTALAKLQRSNDNLPEQD